MPDLLVMAGRKRLILYLGFFVIAVSLFLGWPRAASSLRRVGLHSPWAPKHNRPAHPIDNLIRVADNEHESRLAKRTYGVSQAVRAYREARGRFPPPRFDEYVRWCEEHGVVMVESFFDPLYRDIEPLWSVDPQVVRDFPKIWPHVISIRNGTAKRWTDEPVNLANWMGFYQHGISLLPLDRLPDVDLAFNIDDEPHVLLSHNVLQEALRKAEATKHEMATNAPRLENAFSSYEPLPATQPPKGSVTPLWKWSDHPSTAPLWALGKQACEPGSQASNIPADDESDYTRRPEFPLPQSLSYLDHGYVANWSLAKSSCENPHLRGLHGSWVAMHNHSSYRKDALSTWPLIITPVPLLSACKISGINSDILVPPAVQWSMSPNIDTGNSFQFDEKSKISWRQKKDLVMWRGGASGGVNDENNWTRLQRHRFLIINNGSLVAEHERVRTQPAPAHVPGGTPPLPHNFQLPGNVQDTYNISVLWANDPLAAIRSWLTKTSDTAFVHLQCWPPTSWFTTDGKGCHYNGEYFQAKEAIPSHDQFLYRYQPDIDGATYSGRYRSLVQSNSLPIKATIYDEWHDGRLQAWTHFVPMTNSFVDWWGLLEYFLGYDPAKVEGKSAPERLRDAHGDVGERIATQGAAWARRVMRSEDQMAWMYRLILELARLGDEKRAEIGFSSET